MPRPLFHNLHIYGSSPRFSLAVYKLTEAILYLERAPVGVELSINFVKPVEMHRINYERRGLNTPTDVLTFPGSGSGTPSEAWCNDILFNSINNNNNNNNNNIDETIVIKGIKKEQHQKESKIEILSKKRALLLDIGEIFFSVEYIWYRCCRYPEKNLPFHNYLKAALIHALLHSLGYNHDTLENWKKMSKREKFLLLQLTSWSRRYPNYFTELNGFEHFKLIK